MFNIFILINVKMEFVPDNNVKDSDIIPTLLIRITELLAA